MLSALIWIPVLGAALVGFWPGTKTPSQLRSIALTIASVTVLWTFWLLTQFNIANPGMQFIEFLPWIEPLKLNYKLGVDGLSLPLLFINSFLTWLVIYSGTQQQARPQLYYALILLVNAGVAGGFLAQNLLLFFLFYELELIPFYLLIAVWGGQKREYAAMKFLLYTAISGFLILGAFLGMAWLSETTTFAYESLTTQHLPLNVQLILLTAILIGFGIKIPLVPLHTWLPDAYTEASPAVAILLGGVLAKLGTYGLVRYGLELFPEAWATAAPGIAIIGAISAVYGALSAIAQKDIKRMVAYSSIGHMGYILLACAAATPLSLVGAVSQMVAHSLILAILFHLVGVIETKVGTRDLDLLNGLMSPIRGLPLTSALLVLGGMASAGIPGLVGFVAEYLVLQGSFSSFPVATLICVVCSGLTAVYFVILLNRTCFGKLDNKIAYYPKVNWQERTPAFILAALILFLGIQPTWLVRWSEPTTAAIAASFPANSYQIASVSQDSEVK
ncbi:NADH-quinone oxidoreductase subunit M [Aerosakkonema sp. BLCC-F183]|uniref:NADH-quinone oxidoreductase subunit M n=1 Tax=Aerosakkonema sp. BLCC-F183 TaxID=3342834 RepID=UPI0035BA7045